MTTAHRPTWKAAVGQANEGGWSAGGATSHQQSVLDAPAHTKLKVRSNHGRLVMNNNHNQHSTHLHQIDSLNSKQSIIQQSLLAIEEASRNANQTKQFLVTGRRVLDPKIEEQGQLRLLKQTAEVDVQKIQSKYDDSDIERDDDDDDDESNLDEMDDDDDTSDDDGSDDEEDDEAALQAELAKIRAEREETKQKQEAKLAAEEMVAAERAAVLGNPLLAWNANDPSSSAGVVNHGSGRLKRRWNDDVVFRNQAKNEPKPQKRFINDTVRNDFHKRFLNKFMR